jgi:hypothetical protein
MDILPHLEGGFVEAYLSAFDWDVESTVAAILNEGTPTALSATDHSNRK